MGSPGMTNDRITVHIAADTTPAELQAVAREVASTFDLSLPEAEALLKADVIILKQTEAEALVAICQRLGIRGKMTKPKPPASKTARLGQQTLPWLLALLGVAVLVTLLSLVLPEVSVSSTTQASRTALAEPVQELPVIATDTLEPSTGTSPVGASDSAVPQIASATAEVESEAADPLQASASGVPVIASSPIAEDAAEDTAADAADPATEAPDLFTAARDLAPADVEKALETRTVNTRDAYGQTPLMYAAGSNSSAVITALLTAGADVNAASDAGWTPLMYAARNTNDPAAVQTLLTAGADAAVLNENGQGARDIALAYNNSAAALIPARPEAGTTSARDKPQALYSNPPTPANLPADTAPAVGGGRPITITPRPPPTLSLSFPPPVPVQRAPASTPVAPAAPVVLEPVSSVQPVPQDEERDVILDCLQNWATCGN